MEHGENTTIHNDPVLPRSSHRENGINPGLSPSAYQTIRNTQDKTSTTKSGKISDTRDNVLLNGVHNESRDSAYTRLSSITPEDNGGNHDDRVPENDAFSFRNSYDIDRVTPGFTNSTESYNDGILKNVTWPLAEGSLRLHDPTRSLGASLETSMTSQCELETNKTSHLEIEEDDEEEPKDFNFRELTRDQIIVLVATSLTNLISFLSLSVLAPFFPLEADQKGVSSTISGWIFGVFALVQFVASPPFGHLLPIVGSKFMYIAGLFVCGGCTLLFGVLDKVDTTESTVMFIVLCFVTRVLLALGATGLSNAGFVILVKFFPDNVGTVFGIGEVFTGIGMVAGPALGGFLYSAGGFILPFAVIGGSCFVSLPFIWYYLPPIDDTSEEEDSSLSIKAVLFHPKTVVNSIVIIVSATVWSVLDPTLEPHLRVYDLGPEMIGVLFLIMAAFYSLTSPLWGRIADKLPDNRTLLIPGLLLCAAGLLLSGPSPLLGFQLSFNQLWLTIVSLVILGIGSSMSIIPTYDVYIDVLSEIGYPEDTKSYGMVSGLWVSMYALGDFLGPSVGGFLFDQIGFEWLTTWIGAVCILTGVAVGFSWFLEKKFCTKPDKESSQSGTSNHAATEKTPLLSADCDGMISTYPPSTHTSSVSSF